MSVYLPASCLDITYCNIRKGSYLYGDDYCIFLVIWYTADDAPMTATVEIHLSFLHPLTDLCIRPASKRSSAHPKIQRSFAFAFLVGSCRYGYEQLGPLSCLERGIANVRSYTWHIIQNRLYLTKYQKGLWQCSIDGGKEKPKTKS
jgi:hypothetical protein